VEIAQGGGAACRRFPRFFILPHGRGCEVTLLHGGFSSRPPADKYYAGCAQGWEDCLAKLKLYLETGRTCKSAGVDLHKA